MIHMPISGLKGSEIRLLHRAAQTGRSGEVAGSFVTRESVWQTGADMMQMTDLMPLDAGHA